MISSGRGGHPGDPHVHRDLEVTRATLPMLAILGFGVLVINYVPWLSTTDIGA